MSSYKQVVNSHGMNGMWTGPSITVRLLRAIVVLLWSISRAPEGLVQAQSSNTTRFGIIDLGSTLTTDGNSTWMSQNGTFALGFNSVALHTYTLSIWYATIPVRTVIWTANRNSLVIEGATLRFRGDGNLVLMHTLQVHPIWETNTSSLNVFTAELLDSGNLVLRNAQLDVVWDSFSHPTDVLLPNQKLSAGGELVSSQTSRNAALGRYSLKQDWDGHLRLRYLPSSTWYWTAIEDDANLSTEYSFSYLNSSGFFALYNGSGSVLASWMTTDIGQGPLRHVRLGVGGDLRIYSWSAELASWVVVWKALSDECTVVDLCGSYGLCNYGPEPMCTCPPKFTLVDPNDTAQGCQPPVPINCSTGSKGQQFLKLDNVQFGRGDYMSLQGASETECMQRCSEDCACLGIFYFYNGNGTCALKSQQQSGSIDPTGKSYVKVNSVVNLTVPSPEKSSHPSSRKRLVRPEIVAAIVCGFSLAFFLLSACAYHWWKQSRLHQEVGKRWDAVDCLPGGPLRFSLRDLKAATQSFSLKLGEGDFGSVYKGLLPDGTPVAVKRLDSCKSQPQLADKHFRSMVALLGNTSHQNLVRLYGFCCEGSAHRLLVYEFVPCGSLDRFIFPQTPESSLKLAQIIVADNGNVDVFLDWNKRFTVILGTARALAYLHEQCGECVIHGNFKPENILLDEQFSPKVSDFGLATLVTTQHLLLKEQNKGKPHSLRGGRNSRAYVPPEVKQSKASILTTSGDVYSFGMVVLDIVSGRNRRHPISDPNYGSSSRTTPASANSSADPLHPHFLEGSLQRAFTQSEISEMVDENLSGNFNRQEAERAVRTAVCCVQSDPAARPNMGKVVHMLEGLVPPPRPFQFQQRNSLDRSCASATPEVVDAAAATPDHHALLHDHGNVIADHGTSSLCREFDLNFPLMSKRG